MTKVPRELVVGFNNIYNSMKLAFVRGKSNDYLQECDINFNKWIDKKIPVQTLKNEPLEGYKILNPVCHSASGYSRQDKFRLLDPRGFIIEVSLVNFRNLIENVKDGVIQGHLIYSNLKYDSVWLINADLEEYEYEEISEAANLGVIKTLSDLKYGHHYIIKDPNNSNENVVGYYIGKLDWYSYNLSYSYESNYPPGLINLKYSMTSSKKSTIVKINDNDTLEFYGLSSAKDVVGLYDNETLDFDHIKICQDKFRYNTLQGHKYNFNTISYPCEKSTLNEFYNTPGVYGVFRQKSSKHNLAFIYNDNGNLYMFYSRTYSCNTIEFSEGIYKKDPKYHVGTYELETYKDFVGIVRELPSLDNIVFHKEYDLSDQGIRMSQFRKKFRYEKI